MKTKYGVQITTTTDGTWTVSQLTQKTEKGEFHRTGNLTYVDYSYPCADQILLEEIRKGLKGKIRKVSSR